MAEPFYAQYAAAFKEPAAYDDIARQFLLAAAHMRDSATGLFYHGWDESRKQPWANAATGCSPNFWGRAMGWYMMGLADVLDYVPASHPQRKQLVSVFQTLARDLERYRDPKSGLWYQVVDKPGRDGNYLEASVSAMVTYAYARGARRGWLDARYAALARESFHGIVTTLVTIGADGTINLNHVCSVAGLGGTPYRDGSYEYYVREPQRTNDFKGYGPFLLAAIELESSTNK
jgi:unsaturated rhamnogalacturonyl hydrolase